MPDLLRFNWQGFDAAAGIKVGVGLIVMMVLTSVTGETVGVVIAMTAIAFLQWQQNHRLK